MKRETQTIVATVFCLAVMGAWFIMAPVSGSGWILAGAIIAMVGVFERLVKDEEYRLGLLIFVASAVAWWFHRDLPDARWIVVMGGFGFLAMLEPLRYTSRKK